jgi:hypothetical protein
VKKTAEIAGREELLEILTERARAGSVTAARALLEELRREQAPERPRSDWTVIYGDGSSKPVRRKAS